MLIHLFFAISRLLKVTAQNDFLGMHKLRTKFLEFFLMAFDFLIIFRLKVEYRNRSQFLLCVAAVKVLYRFYHILVFFIPVFALVLRVLIVVGGG